jgi:NADH-quinone oxidoreductase subunit N
MVFSRPHPDQGMIFGGMLRDDWLAFTFRILFLFSAAITALLTTGVKGVRQKGEFYALLVVATLGMNLMAAAADLVMLYLAIETTSIPLYVLAGFLKQDDKSTESGLKYFLFGALTSTVMLYGFSLLYGLAGRQPVPAGRLLRRGGSPSVLAGVLILVLVGFGFKISMVPFHFWSPDVYEGADADHRIRDRFRAAGRRPVRAARRVPGRAGVLGADAEHPGGIDDDDRRHCWRLRRGTSSACWRTRRSPMPAMC